MPPPRFDTNEKRLSQKSKNAARHCGLSRKTRLVIAGLTRNPLIIKGVFRGIPRHVCCAKCKQARNDALLRQPLNAGFIFSSRDCYFNNDFSTARISCDEGRGASIWVKLPFFPTSMNLGIPVILYGVINSNFALSPAKS